MPLLLDDGGGAMMSGGRTFLLINCRGFWSGGETETEKEVHLIHNYPTI